MQLTMQGLGDAMPSLALNHVTPHVYLVWKIEYGGRYAWSCPKSQNTASVSSPGN